MEIGKWKRENRNPKYEMRAKLAAAVPIF